MGRKRSAFTPEENRWFGMVETHYFEKTRRGKPLNAEEEAVGEYIRQIAELKNVKKSILEKFKKH